MTVPLRTRLERQILGAVFLDRDAMDVINSSELQGSDFDLRPHRIIYAAMHAITQRREVIDPLTLADELARRGVLRHAGGKEYITTLLDAVESASDLRWNVRQLIGQRARPEGS